MSKFDEVLKKIEENAGMALTPQQQKPASGTAATPQQQKQALEQFAQAIGVDAIALQKAIDNLKQQQQKAAPAGALQNNQPAV